VEGIERWWEQGRKWVVERGYLDLVLRDYHKDVFFI
jgi:hypothetical protein